jgi:adenine-specific DNA-methyltransferase
LIFVQIDDNEQAYLKILMDEIFGRRNFLTTICIKMSTASGVKTTHRFKTIIKEKEMVIAFSKNKDFVKIYPQYMPTNEWDEEFQYFLERNGSENPDDWNVRRLKDVLKEHNLPFNFKSTDTQEFIYSNKNNIWRRAFIRNEFKSLSQANPDKIFVNKTDKTHYYYRGREMFFLSDKFHKCFTEDGYADLMSNLIGDFWTDINSGKLFSEGNVEFRNSKKPEFLIARLLELSTQNGDLVLDSFLGSGTTAAVAQKMGRHYIGIELGDHCYTHCLPRLKAVVEGEQGGISKAVNWQGGGGFRFYELAPSLLKKDSFGNWIIDSEVYNADLLAAAVAKLNGYYYIPDETTFWKQGKSMEQSYIFTTTQYVTAEYLDNLSKEMEFGDRLLVCCPAFDTGLQKRYDNIVIKKIPQSILDKCEYGKSDYNLNIIDTDDFIEEEYDELEL